jgi:hypothetical protein
MLLEIVLEALQSMSGRTRSDKQEHHSNNIILDILPRCPLPIVP